MDRSRSCRPRTRRRAICFVSFDPTLFRPRSLTLTQNIAQDGVQLGIALFGAHVLLAAGKPFRRATRDATRRRRNARTRRRHVERSPRSSSTTSTARRNGRLAALVRLRDRLALAPRMHAQENADAHFVFFFLVFDWFGELGKRIDRRLCAREVAAFDQFEEPDREGSSARLLERRLV